MFFSNDRKGTDLNGSEGGKELGGVQGGGTVIKIYCLRKESIFNKRGNLKK